MEVKYPILEFKKIKKRFGEHHVLRDVTFSVNENEVFGLLGKSGAGKTTILNILLGLMKKDGGNIFYKGDPIRPEKFHMKRKLGFAAQETSLYPKLSVYENLWYYGRMYGVRKKELRQRINKLLELFDIYRAKDTITSKLSGGMKRRLDLAVSLIHDPDIIILDEPTAGLDIVLSKQIWDLIGRIKDVGKTVIISSHILTQMQQHCTTFGILEEGIFYDQKEIDKFAKKNNVKTLEKFFVKFVESKK